jgi:hypothetical protein
MLRSGVQPIAYVRVDFSDREGQVDLRMMRKEGASLGSDMVLLHLVNSGMLFI